MSARALAALTLICLLLVFGCTGNESAPGSSQATIMPSTPIPPAAPDEPSAQPSGETAENISAAPIAPLQQPTYVNYCYPTFWRGSLEGRGHNDFSNDGCGNYDYSVKIDVVFTMPFDMAAYLNGTDFNFNDCPGISPAAQEGTGDISMGGSFTSVRAITSTVTGMVDKRPDNVATSSGALYTSLDSGIMLSSFPQSDRLASLDGKKYPHIVPGRCTWENGIYTHGDDSVILYMGTVKPLPFQGGRSIGGKWGVGSREMGNFTLSRTN